jgi:glycosyltransferase involved in cell wall biosynthesis
VSRPFFSILTAAYNAEAFIEETIATMFIQTHKDWEWIILNDGSTDRTWEIVTRLASGNPQIRLLENPKNLGLRETLNRLLAQAQGEWVGYLHADDGYRAHTLKTIHDYVAHREDLVMWTHPRLAVGKGIVPNVILPYNCVTEFTSEDFADLLYLKGNVFGGMGNYLFRLPDRSAKLNFVDGNHSVDIRFWIRYLKSHPGRKAVFHPDVLAFMTEHPQSMSIYVKSGELMHEFFTIPLAVIDFDWSFKVRVLQILRLLKCWIRPFAKLDPKDSFLPGQVIVQIVRSFFRRQKSR